MTCFFSSRACAGGAGAALFCQEIANSQSRSPVCLTGHSLHVHMSCEHSPLVGSLFERSCSVTVPVLFTPTLADPKHPISTLLEPARMAHPCQSPASLPREQRQQQPQRRLPPRQRLAGFPDSLSLSAHCKDPKKKRENKTSFGLSSMKLSRN